MQVQWEENSTDDHLGQSVQAVSVAPFALLGYTDKQVPPHADSNKKGDALLYLSHGSDLVLDFTVVHLISPAGAWNESALRTAYNNKMAKLTRSCVQCSTTGTSILLPSVCCYHIWCTWARVLEAPILHGTYTGGGHCHQSSSRC